MLKRTLILGITAACFVVNIGQASANTLDMAASSTCTVSCIYSAHPSNSSTTVQNNLLPENLIFKVIIGTFVEPLDIECSYLRKVRSDLTIEKTIEGRVRYAIGAFDEYQKAVNYCKNLKDKGYVHAKVLAYNQEEVLTMPLDEVLELLGNR